MERLRFAAGATIFAEGDASDHAYLIRSGRVEIVKHTAHGSVRLAVLGEGDIVGEMGLLEERPRSATARALEPVVVDSIAQADFTYVLAHEPEQAIELLRALVERLRTMNQLVAEVATPTGVGTIPQVVLLPSSPKTRAFMPEDGIRVIRFPFRVGRAAENREASVLAFNDLALPDGPPYVLAPSHFALELGADGVVVRDRGSRHGTIVDGTRIGALARMDAVPLAPGEHEIVAATGPLSRESPFCFTAIVSS
jgi:CRP/FNR family transcriptional regulator, cyclic AMP receptor protein